MARSLSNANLLSALVDGASVSITRRGYAAASEGIVVASNMAKGNGSKGKVMKGAEEMRPTMKEASETIYWIPDPVTGYYRPENAGGETDVAELREMALNKTKQH
ncbi:late embryogenesis abundant protein Lea5-D-like [Macadamia integrifolia]|uniref:late embryogenesis abundant protein Lea5-D-like n=1 Tax=Macadamia integrifolia TaxID=60698 RepID=UPI001C4F9AE0|nr:late embryogenesis abundant protein Lea5-D-like [Macadamia integrifolia]